MTMAKNILIFDVVHHMKNMMLSERKINLPKVATPSPSASSALLNDDPASYCKAFLSEKLGVAIKLVQLKSKRP